MHFSPASERNKQPILEVLQQFVPASGRVLEVASGGGQHIAHFAQHFSGLEWIPSELDTRLHESIIERTAQMHNVAPPLQLNVCDPWPVLELDLVLTANLFHISPLQTVSGFFNGAAGTVVNGGWLHVYGPFKQGGEHTSAGNREFDENLRQRNPRWGIRELEDILDAAQQAGFVDGLITAMPANNLSIRWRRP